MADFISFDEGEDWILQNDLEAATVWFLLSSRSCPADINSPAAGEHGGGDTLATGVGEVSYWTGGARQTQGVPVPTAGVIDFATEQWATGAQTDGPASVKSVVMVTSSDNSGKAICAWNLQTGGAARSFALANTTLDFTPDYFLAKVDET
jgi:hypothetical protein